MVRRRRLMIVLFAVLALLEPSGPASAGHRTDPHTRNLHPMGHTDDNRPVTDFFQPFFTDVAFWGRLAYQGVWWGGFRVINVAAPGHPKGAVRGGLRRLPR